MAKDLKLIKPLETIPYISTITDVLADGNCGFRSAALSLGRSPDEWVNIRKEKMKELDNVDSTFQKKNHMTNLFCNTLKSLRFRLDHSSGPCTVKFWMEFPTHGSLFADTYKQPVVVFAKEGSCTYLPLSYPPNENIPICLLFITEYRHVAHFKFKSTAETWPFPNLDAFWKHHANEIAKPWKEKIHKNILIYQKLFPNRRATRQNIFVIEVE